MPTPLDDQEPTDAQQDLSKLPPDEQKRLTIQNILTWSRRARKSLAGQIDDFEARIAAIQEAAASRKLTADEKATIAKLIEAEGPFNDGITEVDRVSLTLLDNSAGVRQLRENLRDANTKIRSTVDTVRDTAAKLEKAAQAIDTIARIMSALATLAKLFV
jgi:chromosome segregation ATPase